MSKTAARKIRTARTRYEAALSALLPHSLPYPVDLQAECEAAWEALRDLGGVTINRSGEVSFVD